MNESEIRSAVMDSLRSVAPESDPAGIADNAPLRDVLDLDSMDFLNFVIAVHAALDVDIPESDYPKVQTLGGAVTYLQGKITRTEVR
jgi:acyl carrier protein